MGKRQEQKNTDPATKNFLAAELSISKHPMFSPIMKAARIVRSESSYYPKHGYACVSCDGTIYIHPKKQADTEAWIYVLAHCLLHLAFGHFQQNPRQDIWNLACDIVVAKFLDEFKLGKPIHDVSFIFSELPASNEESLFDYFIDHGIDKRFVHFGTGNPNEIDMIFEKTRYYLAVTNNDWRKRFALGLRNAVTSAVNVAAGHEKTLGAKTFEFSAAQRAKKWFINSYPLLGSLASTFKILEDQNLCHQMDISVAAVQIEMQEIYINPSSGLTEEECIFVIAHELLHVGLRHDARRKGRDSYLWNVACDYVINAWLVEMDVGIMPAIGVLYDSSLKGESAESVYDIIVTDLRRLRKLATLRGQGKCDMLEPQSPNWWNLDNMTDLDSFYRRCLMQGLEYHIDQERGYLPAGLIEEINALAQPPIPWDVELAQWFDGHLAPLEKIRTYAKPSRRQSGSPDIPRPRYTPLFEAEENRTFGVILDTSGSMDRNLLAKALGAITSYSLSRDVKKVRLVFCDAHAYDQGYVAPEDLAERVKIKGRGGTVLQPGINVLITSDDFPKEGPLLIITDGGCDILSIKRDHAFLIPSYGRLPFNPKGKVFRIQ